MTTPHALGSIDIDSVDNVQQNTPHFLTARPIAAYHGVSILSPGCRTQDMSELDIPLGYISRRFAYNRSVLSIR